MKVTIELDEQQLFTAIRAVRLHLKSEIEELQCEGSTWANQTEAMLQQMLAVYRDNFAQWVPKKDTEDFQAFKSGYWAAHRAGEDRQYEVNMIHPDKSLRELFKRYENGDLFNE